MIYYIIYIFAILFSIFIFFLYLLEKKINQLEKNILQKFKEKNNQIPSIYEVTKEYLIKHDKIFEEILILKKKDFSENKFYKNLSEKSITYKLIHNELNFIFKVCNKHHKLNKNPKFLFIKDNIIEKSNELWNKLVFYKKMVTIFNY